MNHSLFSILIANYNNGRFFNDCYQSIIKQSYTNWEVVIVDDCSTDNSVDIISGMIEHDHRFKLFHNPVNKGCGYTKHKCVELANGEICGFLDPDDALARNAVEVSVSKHIDFPQTSMTYSKVWACDENLNPIAQSNVIPLPEGKSFLTATGYVVSHFAAFKREKYLQSNGLDIDLKRAVDQDLYYKLEETGNLYFINQPLYYYRIHRGGISLSSSSKALAWKLYAIINACHRRNIDLNICMEEIVAAYIEKISNSKEAKTGRRILRPFRYIKHTVQKIINRIKR